MLNAFKERRPWAAAVLTLIFGPFIGMLYLGRGRLALLYLAVAFACAVALLLLFPQILASQLAGSTYILEFPIIVAGAIHANVLARTWQPVPRWYARWYSIVAIWLVFPVAAILIRAFLYQPFNTPSVSMEPSLMTGDYFFVSKFTYNHADPKRGDIVVFRTALDGGAKYVKRVVGLPGDKIQMVAGRLVINGVTLPLRRIADFLEPCDAELPCHVTQYLETLPGGATDRILDRAPNTELDNTGVFIVPPGHYFVLGDNRDNSDDSRDHVGYVAREDIVGRVAIKFVAAGHAAWQPVN